jgi:DNA-binding NarL/FixJ family response regulator
VIHVVLATELRIYSEGLQRVLAREPDMTVEIARGWTRIEQVDERADSTVVLVDMAMADAGRGLRALTERHPQLCFVTLGTGEHDELSCAEAGAAGWVGRDDSFVDLVATIRAAAHDELRCSAYTAREIARRLASLAGGQTATPGAKLTGREREILTLVDEGLSNKEIATRLCIAQSTVKNHVHHLLEKLGVQHRFEAGPAARGRHRRSAPALPA